MVITLRVPRPDVGGLGLAWTDVAVMLAWTVASAAVAVRMPWHERS